MGSANGPEYGSAEYKARGRKQLEDELANPDTTPERRAQIETSLKTMTVRDNETKAKPPEGPDLTDDAVKYARMAEARRLRMGRGRKSTFLSQYVKENASTELSSMPVNNDVALGG